jgi:hypothetical protein
MSLGRKWSEDENDSPVVWGRPVLGPCPSFSLIVDIILGKKIKL